MLAGVTTEVLCDSMAIELESLAISTYLLGGCLSFFFFFWGGIIFVYLKNPLQYKNYIEYLDELTPTKMSLVRMA